MPVVELVNNLLRIVLMLMPDRAQVKGHLDRLAVRMANEAADAAEREKFDPPEGRPSY